MEGFLFGRALILLPFFGDPSLIARLLEGRQAGLEVPKNEQEGSFTSDSMAQTLKMVVKAEEGKIYRDKAKEMSSIVADRDLQSKNIDGLVQFLDNHKLVKKD